MKNNKMLSIILVALLGVSSIAMAKQGSNSNNAATITRIFGAHINQIGIELADNDVRRCWEHTREYYTAKNKIDNATMSKMKKDLTKCWKYNNN